MLCVCLIHFGLIGLIELDGHDILYTRWLNSFICDAYESMQKLQRKINGCCNQIGTPNRIDISKYITQWYWHNRMLMHHDVRMQHFVVRCCQIALHTIFSETHIPPIEIYIITHLVDSITISSCCCRCHV